MFQKPTALFDAYIFDLDGTVYLGDRLLPTAGPTIERIRRLGKRTLFLSNNPTQTRGDYAARLTRLGLPTAVDDVINSSFVMLSFLKRYHPQARLFVIGEASIMAELQAAGFELTEDARRVDAVIVSFDRTFDYHKLQVGFDALRAGAHFFATNADKYCPVPGGGEPDAGALIAALEAATDIKCEAVVGKPSRYTAEAILSLIGLPPERCIMTGDRLETDVLLGLNAGMAGALTLTGATPATALAGHPIQPTYVLTQLADLLVEVAEA